MATIHGYVVTTKNKVALVELDKAHVDIVDRIARYTLSMDRTWPRFIPRLYYKFDFNCFNTYVEAEKHCIDTIKNKIEEVKYYIKLQERAIVDALRIIPKHRKRLAALEDEIIKLRT